MSLIFATRPVLAVKILFLLTLRSFFLPKELGKFMMGSRQSKKNKLKVVNRLLKGKEFSHLTAVGKIIFSKDVDFGIIQVERNL